MTLPARVGIRFILSFDTSLSEYNDGGKEGTNEEANNERFFGLCVAESTASDEDSRFALCSRSNDLVNSWCSDDMVFTRGRESNIFRIACSPARLSPRQCGDCDVFNLFANGDGVDPGEATVPS